MRRTSRIITDEEVDLLKYSLRIDNNGRGIKSALQSLCLHYEANRLLEDTSSIRQLIHSHLGSTDVLLRRWSMKALGLIGDPDDAARIVDRLKVESDQEAQTWGTAALLGSSADQSIGDILSRSSLDSSIPLLLAARLYAPDSWIRKHYQPIQVNPDDDELTLKWAVFLIGYNRAPADLFDPKYKNSVFLVELNEHSSDELSEYSVWALYERPEYGYADVRTPVHRIGSRPENVRKWLYRLILKSPEAAQLDPDMLHDLSLDRSVSAREGLAQGIIDLEGGQFDNTLLEWFLKEKMKR